MPILVQPQDCCSPCPTVTTTDIPGSPGATGAAGADGTDGVDSFTLTTADFTMPAEGGVVTVDVANSSWMTVGQFVFAGKFGSASSGTFQVNQVPDATHVVLTNVANTASGAYAGNSAAGTVFPSATQVAPAGQQGPAGAAGAGGAPTDATYVTQTANPALSAEYALAALPTGLLHVTLATGADGTRLENTSSGGQAPNDGALVAGDIVFATAIGIETKTVADAKTALSIGSIASQSASAIAVTGGTISGVTVSNSPISGSTGSFTTLTATTNWALTPSGLQTLAAANLIAYAPKVRVAGNAAPVTMTSTPTLALGTVDGQECLVMGTNDTNTVTLQDDGSLAGSKLRLGAASRVLGAGDSVRLSWDSALGMWCETSFTALV